MDSAYVTNTGLLCLPDGFEKGPFAGQGRAITSFRAEHTRPQEFVSNQADPLKRVDSMTAPIRQIYQCHYRVWQCPVVLG